MMKKPILLLFAATVAALCTACGELGGGPKMNSVEATALVAETVRKNVDSAKWKIYRILWQEGEELGNELQLVTVWLVNDSGDCFNQRFTLAGPGKGTVTDLSKATGQKRVDFERVNGIAPERVDPAAIQKQFEEALATIPDNYTFKSISSYDISETLSSGVELFDRGKNVGEIKAQFDVNVTENGKEMIENAGKKSIQYYQITFNVQPDGSVEMDD